MNKRQVVLGAALAGILSASASLAQANDHAAPAEKADKAEAAKCNAGNSCKGGKKKAAAKAEKASCKGGSCGQKTEEKK